MNLKSLLASDFVGSFTARDDLSEDYKKFVKEVVDAKYPDHE